jgi:putative membrane protein
MWGFGWGFGWGFMFLAPICMILVGLAIYFVLTSYSRGSSHVHYSREMQPQAQGKAVEILNERYAKGEITKEEYLQMRKTLQ